MDVSERTERVCVTRWNHFLTHHHHCYETIRNIMYVIRRRQQSRCLSTSIVGLWCRLYQFGAFLQSHGISKWLEGRRPEWRSTAIHPTGTGSQWFTARCGVLIDGIYWIGLLFRSRDWCVENNSTAQSRFGVCVWSRWVLEVLTSSSISLSSFVAQESVNIHSRTCFPPNLISFFI